MNYRERTKLIDGLCGTFLMALLVEAFYGLVDYAFTIYHYSIASVTNIVYVLAGIILVASIGILIAAYKKDNGTMGVYGAELMALSITATTLPGTYISLPHPFNKLNMIFPLVFGIYYLGKAMKQLSRDNNSNVVCMAIMEMIFALVLSYGLLNLTTPLFYVGSAIAVITFIISIKKKSKKHLVHGLEIMFVALAMLIATTKSPLIFLAVLMGIYYMFKTVRAFFASKR